MDSRNGVWQCTRLVVRYCTHSYGSRGAKEFVDEVVPALKMEFPQLDLVVEKRSGKPPFLEGFYKNGRRKPIGVKGQAADEISKLAQQLVNQWGGKNVLHSGKRIVTRSPTVQGLWTPFTNRPPA